MTVTAPQPSVTGRTAGSGSALLVIESLCRRFGDHEVLRDLSLTVEPGQRVAFTGPNGAGKTTALRCVAGTIAPTSGRISILGHAAGTMSARRHLGVSLSQERSFYMRLSSYENLLFYARLRFRAKRDAARQVAALVEELELEDIAAERADRCSTGMLQQLGIARALLGEPELLLLDEPTRSLDVDAVERLWGALGRRPQAGVLMATHRAEDIERCEQRVDLSS